MCTICGHFGQKGKRSSTDIYDMLRKMKHRGPDTIFLKSNDGDGTNRYTATGGLCFTRTL